ncbi:MAG: YbjQ family protein [Candidatus Omnitrophica bacterium]|nr:YbjQ family protein [Candidatus Omnitrophota bacterium]
MEELIGIVFTVGLIVIAYFSGKHIETKHYADIKRRERDLLYLPSVTIGKSYDDKEITDCRLVTGNVVISGDYFKMILAGILNFFGGRVIGYESLIDRARREAILRMKEEAQQFGADAIINARFETSKLDSMTQQQGTGMFEILAYGTAIKVDKSQLAT